MTTVWLSVLTSFVFTPWAEALRADIMRARLLTCSDCEPVVYPEVLEFIEHDLPFFHNVETVQRAGKSPELVLLDKNNEEKESFRIDLLFKEEIYDLLLALGFYAKLTLQQTVPEEFLTGPYIRKEDELDHLYELLDELIAEDDEEEEWRRLKRLVK